MKESYIRTVDELGRVVLPKELRDVLDLNPGDQVELYRIPRYQEIGMIKYAPESPVSSER